MATILITGGTGMIGKALTGALLEKGHHVIILTRKKPAQATSVSYAEWDFDAQTIETGAIASADHIIHLAGANVGEKRWTSKRKKEIADSRVKSGELLVKSLEKIPNKVRSVISASAIGWYGPDPNIPNLQPFTEEQPAYDDFLGQTCREWEQSLLPVRQLGKRLVTLRTAIVLGKDNGALKEFMKPLRFGVATIMASGRQVVSWIHIDDLVRLYVTAIENENLQGVYNAVAPQPVSNKELVLQLASLVRGKMYIPVHVPAFVLRLVLGEMSIEVLKSATISSEKITGTGFAFQYPGIPAALASLVR